MPDFRARVIPWKLLARLVGVQAGILLLGLGVSGVDPWVGLLVLAVFLGASVFLGRKLFLPLGRLIEKASRSDDAWVGPEVPELAEDDGSEWEDVESALDRIRSDRRDKANALLQERTELGVLMASISDAILAVDESGRILFFNSRFALLFGGNDLAQKRTSLREVFRAPEVAETFFGALREVRSREASVQLLAQGEAQPRFFTLGVTPLRREGGEVYGAVGVFHDVSEMKRAERMRIDFVANVSHELRTPLTAIKGYTDTVKGDLSARRHEDLPQFVDVISRNADRLLALIDDLLDLSSLESGAELDLQAVPTRDATERVLRQLEPKRRAKDITLEVEASATQVLADPRRLEQVLVNLVDNALKYVQAGGKVRVIWEPLDSRGVQLRVSDNGPGIPADSIGRLFERFYRIDKARSREVGGTGLGLAIVKHILQRHGGSVSVRSELGRGSEFICEFPSG